MKWRLDKVIERIARGVARKAAAAIRGAAPRVQHRDGSAAAGAVGGSLVKAILSPAFVRVSRWGAVLQWHSLGQEGLWFRNGTSRQKARPFELSPDPAAVTAEIQADAEAFWERRARRGEA